MQNQLVKSNKIRVRVGTNSYGITLFDNAATKSFKALLPLTIRMKDLNNNEKHYDLPEALPTNESNPKSIKTGDLMLYGSNTLVLFYKSFSTTYSYTKLGQIDDPSKLESVLGSREVFLTFE